MDVKGDESNSIGAAGPSPQWAVGSYLMRLLRCTKADGLVLIKNSSMTEEPSFRSTLFLVVRIGCWKRDGI
eukprot:scaffold169749_cov60-Cyclotella_meneghiniana.AAC.1